MDHYKTDSTQSIDKVNQINERITAYLISDAESYLLEYFDSELFIRGKTLIHEWMYWVCGEADSSYWKFYELSNGAFYMTPDEGTFKLEWAGNYFNEKLSADAAGIVATLLALLQLAEESRAKNIATLYEDLCDFATQHVDESVIYKAIGWAVKNGVYERAISPTDPLQFLF